MYYVNKIVGWILCPLGIAFIGFGVGATLRMIAARAAFAEQRALPRWAQVGRKLGSWMTALSVVFLWIMSCGITTRLVGVGLEREWERDGMMHGSIEEMPNADAIVVLGGGVGAHEKCHAPELYSGADRVWHGARLYKALSQRIEGLRVFCTGGGCEYATVPLLADLGVPREAIWFSEEPRNTEEEANLIKRQLKRQLAGGNPRICLVTSAWHMSRAKLLFDRAGFDVVPAPTDFEMNCAAEEPVKIGDFFPSSDALLRNSCAIKEWVARFGYSALRR